MLNTLKIVLVSINSLIELNLKTIMQLTMATSTVIKEFSKFSHYFNDLQTNKISALSICRHFTNREIHSVCNCSHEKFFQPKDSWFGAVIHKYSVIIAANISRDCHSSTDSLPSTSQLPIPTLIEQSNCSNSGNLR